MEDNEKLNIEIEQYKIAVETADKTTDRRYNFNRFMILIMSALLAAIATICTTKAIFFTIPIGVIGIKICNIWLKQINCFKNMIEIKYNTLKRIEKDYPSFIDIYIKEGEQRDEYKKTKDFKSFSEQEKLIAKAFKLGFTLYLSIIFIIILTNLSPILFLMNMFW